MQHIYAVLYNHPPHFLILPEFLSNTPTPKYNITLFDWVKVDEKTLIKLTGIVSMNIAKETLII